MLFALVKPCADYCASADSTRKRAPYRVIGARVASFAQGNGWRYSFAFNRLAQARIAQDLRLPPSGKPQHMQSSLGGVKHRHGGVDQRG